MKGFLKAKWRGIPIGILTAVLVLALVAVGTWAVVRVWGGKAEITVTECITVTNIGGDDADFDLTTHVCNVSLQPGECKILGVRVWNSSTAAVPVTASAVWRCEDITAAWNPASSSIPGKDNVIFTLTVCADTDVPVQSCNVTLGFTRG